MFRTQKEMTMEKRRNVPTVHVVYDFRHRATKAKKVSWSSV